MTKYDKSTKNLTSMYARIVCGEKNPDIIKVNLERMIRPLAIFLIKNFTESSSNPELPKLLAQKTALLSCIFSRLEFMIDFEENNPIIPIYKELGPVLMNILKKFQSEEKLVENICLVIKYTMRSIKQYFMPYLEEFVGQVIEGYKNFGISTYLYCGEFTASVFGSKPEAESILGTMFNSMGKHTFELLINNGYTNFPHIVEDFFGMCLRYIKYTPKLIFGSEILPELLQFSIVIIGFNHSDAAKALYLFLNNFFRHFANKNTEDDINSKEAEAFGFIIENGALIIKKLILYIASGSHKGLCDYVIELIIEIYSSFPQTSALWILSAIQLVYIELNIGS